MKDIIYLRDLEGYKKMTDKQKKYVSTTAAYDLTLLPTEQMRKEMRAFLEDRIPKISIATLMSEKTRYNALCRFIQQKGKNVESFRDWERAVWIKKLKAWILKEGLSLTMQYKEVYGTIGVTRSFLIRYLDTLLDYLEPEDVRPEKEKDIWVLDNLDIPYRKNLVDNYRTLNFTKISQQALREETKKGIYLNLQSEAITCIAAEMGAMRRLSAFLKERYPKVRSCKDFDRELIENYLLYRRTEKPSGSHLRSELTRLRALLESIGKAMEYPHLAGLFLNRDLPPTPKTAFKAYSDAELKRLNAEIVQMDEQMARFMIIHQMLGTRISDTLTLQTDCLVQKDEEWLIRIRQMKTKTYVKPVSAEVASLLRRAIQYTREKYGETIYIFVDENDHSKPMQYDTILVRVVKMIREKDLRDDNGRPFGFKTHMYRHTYGMKLTEMHLDDWTIARLLGHNNLRNVKYYRKMGSQLLADETRKARQQISMRILSCLDGWEEEYEQVRQDDCIQ